MWLASDHHCSDTASGQAPSKQTKDCRSHGDRPDGEVRRFSAQPWKRYLRRLVWRLPRSKRPQYKREFSYGAFQVSGRLGDDGRHGVRKLLSFFASSESQIVASKLSILTEQLIEV